MNLVDLLETRDHWYSSMKEAYPLRDDLWWLPLDVDPLSILLNFC